MKMGLELRHLQIMDPKMDSGCMTSGDEFEELYDVSKPLLPEEVLGIIDQLLCHEVSTSQKSEGSKSRTPYLFSFVQMSWHSGYPLSQTIFTSVYVEAISMPNPRYIEEAHFLRHANTHDPEEDPMLEVLRAYCIGMLKACGYVNERIKSEHYYEVSHSRPIATAILTGI